MRTRSKHVRKEQDRRGNPKRRALEAVVIADQLARRKEAFTERLKRITEAKGQCIVATCTKDHNGYPRMNFRYQGRIVTIHVMRVIAIMRNKCQPIPIGYDIGHTDPSNCGRDCVSHIEPILYKINANTAAQRSMTTVPVGDTTLEVA